MDMLHDICRNVAGVSHQRIIVKMT